MPSKNAYVRVRVREHPRAHDGYVLEHILVVEQALGHYLSETAEVHHVDGERRNNAPTNLVACQDNEYHKLLHRRQRALEACGDAGALRCKFCHGYARQSDIVRGKKGEGSYHRNCHRRYENARRARAVAS